MSFSWYKWAKKQKGLSPAEKAVLIAIADYYNDENGCAWPSQETLAEDTSYSRSTIARACNSLRAKGLISWKNEKQKSGHYSSNEYKLHAVSKSDMADYQSALKHLSVSDDEPPPCRTVLQKPLEEPLKLTLNNTQSKKIRTLSAPQEALAEEWAAKLISMHKGEYFSYSAVISDVRLFLMSNQTEDDWLKLQNGLPNPRKM